MIIKRWDTTLNAGAGGWAEHFPKTTAGQIYASDGTTPIFDANTKIKPLYLPDAVFDSLFYFNAISANTNLSAMASAALSAATTAKRSPKGYYWVITTQSTLTADTVSSGVYYTTSFTASEGASPVTLEAGDWVILTEFTGAGTSGDPYIAKFATVNNTYESASDTVPGIIKLGSGTTQTTAANGVTSTAGRTYAIQNNGSGQLVVNVPWADTTYSKATAAALGLVKLADATVQTVAANASSTTASRTYGIQFNASDQMVVNVPWTDTVYSHPSYSKTETAGTETTLTDITLIDSLTTNATGHLTGATYRKLVAGANISITPAADGNITVANTYTYTHPTYTHTVVADTETTLSNIQLAIAGISTTNGHINGTGAIEYRKLVAGSNVSITPAANGDITFASTNTTYTASDGLVLDGTNVEMLYPLYVQADAPTGTIKSNAIWLDI